MPFSALAGAALALLTLTNAGATQAAQTVCSAIWSLPLGTPGGTKSAPIQGANPPCPASSILATVDLGAGGGFLVESVYPWDSFVLSNQYPTTSASAIAIGSAASTASDLKVVFNKPTPNPYFSAA